MNKQEFQQTIKNMKPPKFFTAITLNDAYEAGFEEAKGNALCNSCFLNEPEKPVVPQFVADFYESIKDDFEVGVYDLCIRLYTCNLEGKIKYWFDCDDKKPIETLAKMKFFGYEVEKEKLYRVELPGSHKHGDIILVKDDDGDITYDVVFSDKWKERDYTKLTESEIKEDFEWAWQFAKEVEE